MKHRCVDDSKALEIQIICFTIMITLRPGEIKLTIWNICPISQKADAIVVLGLSDGGNTEYERNMGAAKGNEKISGMKTDRP